MDIGIFGAGAIGGYLGVNLSAAGAAVTMIVRADSKRTPPRRALRLDGRELLASDSLRISSDPADLADVRVCVLAVKSRDTEDASRALAAALPADAVVVSFQNGLFNAQRLRRTLGDRVVSGVVGYNVVVDSDGSRRQASSGKLLAGLPDGVAGYRMRRLRTLLLRSGEQLELRADIDDVVAGKLLLNLHNGICAATGLGIADAIRSADARWCYAQSLQEALQIMRASGLQPTRVAALPPRLLAPVLSLPNAIIRPLFPLLIRVDDSARSSTLQDLASGRATEIDALNGAIVELAEQQRLRAPRNERIVELVHRHELRAQAGEQPQYLSAADLRQQLLSLSH